MAPEPLSTEAQAAAAGLATPQNLDLIAQGDDAILRNARFTADALSAAAAAQAEAETRAPADAALLPAYDPAAVFAVVDEDGRRTWLEAAPDGRPTDYSAALVGEVLGPALEDSLGLAAQDTDITGLSFAVVDEDGRRTWLEADEAGRPTPRALALIGAASAPAATSAVALVGDSMTAQGTWDSTLSTLSGRDVVKLAVGGETSAGIAARLNAVPYMLTPAGGTIPSSGPVNVTFTTDSGITTWPMLQGPTVNPGTLAGVPGTFSITRAAGATQYVHDDGDVYTFTRSTAGDPVPVPHPAPFYYDSAAAARERIHVYWTGRNNWTQPDQITRDLEAMIQRQPDPRRFLVIGVCNGAGEGTGTEAHTTITAYNKRLEKYGRRYVKVREHLIRYGLSDLGITPTAQDEADMAADTLPDSLRTDSLHLEPSARDIVARLVHDRLNELEW